MTTGNDLTVSCALNVFIFHLRTEISAEGGGATFSGSGSQGAYLVASIKFIRYHND